MLYALLMAAVFSLLLQFYLNRQTAHQRNLLAQQERQEAYAIALLTKDQKLADSGQFSFNKGQSQYQKEKDQLIVNVVISDRTYDFTFAIKEPKARLDKDQDKDKVCVWVYGLFTDVPGDYVKKPMKECTGKEITEEWLYHLGVPVEDIEDLAENSAVCVPTMMPYITAFFMPRTKGDRPDVIPDGCVNAAFLGQFAETPRDTIFTTEYSVRTAMEAVYGLCGVDRGVPEVWGSVYDIRELLDSTVKLMDGRSPLEMKLPMPLEALKKPILRKIDKTVVGKLLRDHGVLKDWMV